MRRSAQWGVALIAILASGSARAIMLEETLEAKAQEGCKVQVTVMLPGHRAEGEVRRARGRHGFRREGCYLALAKLDALRWQRDPEPPAPSAPWIPQVTYQRATFTDEVCGDGEWTYAVHRQGQGTGDDHRPSAKVEVSGCKPVAPCAPRLEAPGRVRLEEVGRRCELAMGWMKVGDVERLERRPGEAIDGKGVVALEERGGELFARALAPGISRFMYGEGCLEFTVKVNQYVSNTLEDRKRWAFRSFPRRGADEQIISLERAPWVVPLEGALRFDEPRWSDLSLGVDEQCRPVIASRHAGDIPYSGAMLTEADGSRHLYYFHRTKDDPTLPCTISGGQAAVMVGQRVTHDESKPVIRGALLLEKVGRNAFIAKQAGTVVYSVSPNFCGSFEIEEMPRGREAKIAWVRRQLRLDPAIVPRFVTLRVGESTPLGFDPHGASNAGWGIELAPAKGGWVIRAREPGLLGSLIADAARLQHFLVVDASGTD